jgi:hypothetical protein
MLSQVVHSLLLLPASTVRPMLNDLLRLLCCLDQLNGGLPASAYFEASELEWCLTGTHIYAKFLC